MYNTTNWNNVVLLFFSQALFQTATILVMTLSGMVGLEMAEDKSWATLPIAMISVGAAVMMIPASLVIRKLGQRNGFMVGTLIGVMAGLVSYYGILQNSFAWFVAGNTLVGCYQGFAQYYRFAAADSVPEANKGKAISWVIAGGVVAAIAGPTLATHTQHLGTVTYAYSYISITLLSILALGVIFFLRPQPKMDALPLAAPATGEARPLTEIIRKKDTITALISSAIGYSVMMMIMTATPLAMHHHGHSPADSATVIQWHVLGMFVPSFFTGTLIAKFGARRIILAGIIMLFLQVSLSLSGTDFLSYISGLVLLGIGWNFMFIGGSTLLTSVYQPIEKEKTQAFHDFLVFAAISISGFSAGGLLNLWGWQGVNLAVIPLLIIALIRIGFPKNNRPSAAI